MLADTFQVTTMTKTWCLTVASFVSHSLESIILRITIRKAVWHQHIEHILIAKAHALITSHFTVFQLVLHLLDRLTLLEFQGHFSRLCTL